jgi:hypothetical protein
VVGFGAVPPVGLRVGEGLTVMVPVGLPVSRPVMVVATVGLAKPMNVKLEGAARETLESGGG